MTHCVECGWLLDEKYGPHDLCALCADILFLGLKPKLEAANERYWYEKALDSRLGPEKKLKMRQAFVCSECGHVIKRPPSEEDWVCPGCGRGTNLELTMVVKLEGPR